MYIAESQNLYDELTRGNIALLSFPRVRTVSSYNFVSVHPPTTRSLIQNSTVMSLSDCTIILVALIQAKI